MIEIIITLLMCSLLGGTVLLIWVCAWDFFEDTELWEILKDKITRKEE